MINSPIEIRNSNLTEDAFTLIIPLKDVIKKNKTDLNLKIGGVLNNAALKRAEKESFCLTNHIYNDTFITSHCKD